MDATGRGNHRRHEGMAMDMDDKSGENSKDLFGEQTAVLFYPEGIPSQQSCRSELHPHEFAKPMGAEADDKGRTTRNRR